MKMKTRDLFFFAVGIGFLALAKAKNIIQGYSSPKPFDISEVSKCIDYDIHVVEGWLSHLQKYTGSANSFLGKNILELGPGSDLGIGIYLLSKGCFQYNACDVNDLMKATPDYFYEKLFSKLEENKDESEISLLKEQLNKSKTKQFSQLNYIVRKDFDIASAFGKNTVDIVFSQAAFEHFDDIESTISQLTAVCKSGAILLTEIDLKTHSRWIRDKDPNNIYRYPKWFYKLFWFRGIPNRVRPFQYIEILERLGWTDIKITPLRKENDYKKAYSGINRAFTEEKNQMDYLSVVICARK